MNTRLLKTVLLPTPFQAAISLMLGVLVLAWLFHSALAALIVNGSRIDSKLLTAGYQEQISNLNSFSLAQTGAVALFWVAVGLIVYLLYLTVANFAVNIINRFIVTASYVNRGRPSLSRPLHQLGFLAACVLLTAVSIKWLFPGWVSLVGQFVIPTLPLTHLPYALAGVVGLALNIYVLWLTGTLALHPGRLLD